jgi:hypothetical protein
MAQRILPCGCLLQWNADETTIVFCSVHTVDYMRWEGSDRDFIKTIATPKIKVRPRIEAS